jgi:hypothetical protein
MGTTALAVVVAVIVHRVVMRFLNMEDVTEQMFGAGGNWAIADCNGNPVNCEKNCDRLGGEWLPEGGSSGSNGGCWCNGCQGMSLDGRPPMRSRFFSSRFFK